MKLHVPDLRKALMVEPTSCNASVSPALNGAANVFSDTDVAPLIFLRRSQTPVDGVTRSR